MIRNHKKLQSLGAVFCFFSVPGCGFEVMVFLASGLGFRSGFGCIDHDGATRLKA